MADWRLDDGHVLLRRTANGGAQQARLTVPDATRLWLSKGPSSVDAGRDVVLFSVAVPDESAADISVAFAPTKPTTGAP